MSSNDKRSENAAPQGSVGTHRTDPICRHPLAKRPILYTDSIKGTQVCRDDLWAVTTEELNALLPPTELPER
jgi:hypothetical protein